MSLSVLSVAYPFAPVGPAAVGGAEQILASLDAALLQRGHRSLVLACEGSRTAGELFTLPLPPGDIDETSRARAWAQCAQAIEAIRSRERPDIVHLHGIDFARYLPASGRTLVTLHLPLDWYDAAALRPARGDLWLHGVSEAQYARAPAGARLRAPIANGVDLEALRPGGRKRGYALWLGRICPEKGPHLAIEAAARAKTPLLMAGRTFDYDSHRRYFEGEIAPRLGGRARLLPPVGGERKRRLIAGALCLLVPSLAEETSSLVAMEALACGAPVVAFRRGALPDIVDHGRTGFLADDAEDMARAIPLCADLSPRDCRREAERRFSREAMISAYLGRYDEMMRRGAAA